MNTETIDLHLIMGLHDRGPYEWTAIESGWTEYDIEANGEGYDEAIEEARKECDDVRVLVVSVPADSVDNLFKMEHRTEAVEIDQEADA